MVHNLPEDCRVKDEELIGAGIHSALMCPLTLGSQVFGAIGVLDDLPRQFDVADILFAETISQLIASTIGRDHSERLLAAERRFAATLLATVESMVVVMNPGGYLRQLNRAAERITGFSSDEMADRPVFALLLPEGIDRVRSVLNDVQAGGTTVSFECGF